MHGENVDVVGLAKDAVASATAAAATAGTGTAAAVTVAKTVEAVVREL